jgi:nitric oxide reductase NorQ protein
MKRNQKRSGLEEGAGTHLPVQAAKLIADGVNPVVACRSCIAEALTDGAKMLTAYYAANQW